MSTSSEVARVAGEVGRVNEPIDTVVHADLSTRVHFGGDAVAHAQIPARVGEALHLH